MQNEKFFISYLCNAVEGDITLPKNAHKTGKEIPK